MSNVQTEASASGGRPGGVSAQPAPARRRRQSPGGRRDAGEPAAGPVHRFAAARRPPPTAAPCRPRLQASPLTRARVFFAGVPLVTRCTFAACVGVYTASVLGRIPFGAVCLSPWPVLHGQVYRLLSSALSHAGPLHLLLNMLALLPTATGLERSMGSVQLLWLMCLLVALGGAAYVAVAAVAAQIPPLAALPMLDFGHQCAVGFSGGAPGREGVWHESRMRCSQERRATPAAVPAAAAHATAALPCPLHQSCLACSSLMWPRWARHGAPSSASSPCPPASTRWRSCCSGSSSCRRPRSSATPAACWCVRGRQRGAGWLPGRT